MAKNKELNSKEAMKSLSKGLKEALNDFKKQDKKDLGPREAGGKIVEALKEQIREYQDTLVKMRKLEKSGDDSMEKAFPTANRQPGAKCQNCSGSGKVDVWENNKKKGNKVCVKCKGRGEEQPPAPSKKGKLPEWKDVAKDVPKEPAEMSKAMGIFHILGLQTKGAPQAKGPHHPIGSDPQGKAPGDPQFGKGWATSHIAPHGMYITQGSMKTYLKPNGMKSQDSGPVDVLYIPHKTQKAVRLGTFKSKEEAESAKLAHHDKVSAGLGKEEPKLDKTTFGLASQPHSDKEHLAEFGVKKEELEIEQRSDKISPQKKPVLHHPPNVKGAVLPSDKPSKDVSLKDHGAGGQITKGKSLKKIGTNTDVINPDEVGTVATTPYQHVARSLIAEHDAAQRAATPSTNVFSPVPRPPVAPPAEFGSGATPIPKLTPHGQNLVQTGRAGYGQKPLGLQAGVPMDESLSGERTATLNPSQTLDPNKTVVPEGTHVIKPPANIFKFLAAKAVQAPSSTKSFDQDMGLRRAEKDLEKMGGSMNASRGPDAAAQMKSHALSDAWKDAQAPVSDQMKNVQMPTGQQQKMDPSLPLVTGKMLNPQPPLVVGKPIMGGPGDMSRANSLAAQTPPGKWQKSELLKEMENIDKNIGYAPSAGAPQELNLKEKKVEEPISGEPLCKMCGKKHHGLKKGCDAGKAKK